MVTYHKYSFRGGSNINIIIITCDDNIVIPSILQSYVLHWYHTYLLHPLMNRTEVTIHQNLYWPGMIYAVCKEVKCFDTCQCSKRSNIKYSKLPAKEA